MPRRRSLFLGWTGAIALVTAAALFALYSSVDWTLRAAGSDVAKRAIDADLVAFADIYESGGQAELLNRLNDRLALNGATGPTAYYRLATKDGRRIAGGPELADAPDPAVSQFTGVTLPGIGSGYARATLLDRNLVLTVGHDAGSWEEGASRVRRALLLAGLGVSALVVLIGAIATWKLRLRIEIINTTLARIEQGALDERLPPHLGHDEIGSLAIHANRVIDHLARAVRAHRDISDHTAHEVRTPLTHLSLRLHSILESGDLGEARHVAEMVARARQDIAEVTAVLDSLLDISHSEAHRDEFNALPTIDFSSLIAEIAELYEDNDGELACDIAPDIRIPGDRMQLARMVANLLDNAFKYGDSRAPRVNVSLRPGPVLTIGDNGPGVSPELREHIFGRFARGPTGNVKGHGLGLALARAIAERHGLRLNLVDTLSAGATFQVERRAHA